MIPIFVIFYLGIEQYEQKQLIEYQRKTEQLTQAINKRLFKRRVYSYAITADEFEYYQHIYNPVTQEITQSLSLLADPKYYKRDSGVIGYFQFKQNGQFNSPVWPYLIGSESDKNVDLSNLNSEQKSRRELALEVLKISSSSAKIQEFLNEGFPKKADWFDVISDLPEYFVFYRVVENNGQKKLQGYLADRKQYLHSRIERGLELVSFEQPIQVSLTSSEEFVKKRHFYTQLNENGELQIRQSENKNTSLSKTFISEHQLNWPLNHYKVSYAIADLRMDSAITYTLSLIIILGIAVALGCYGFYRIGVRQIKLAEERLNFVSSVSHELKTPLTSIRMYSEMLKTGQVLSEEHQRDYYEFIFTESERLSRLIDNILQLAKLSQPQHSVDPKYTKLSVLIDIIHSKVSSLVDKNGFKLNVTHDFDDAQNIMLLVDVDAFAQVVINITDNAVKFFDKERISDVSRQQIDVNFALDSTNSEHVILSIRDYGVGISAEQEDKLFELFYRGGSELTRTTQGTGIGLSLVNELMIAQHGSIHVERMEPGLTMKMAFKYK